VSRGSLTSASISPPPSLLPLSTQYSVLALASCHSEDSGLSTRSEYGRRTRASDIAISPRDAAHDLARCLARSVAAQQAHIRPGCKTPRIQEPTAQSTRSVCHSSSSAIINRSNSSSSRSLRRRPQRLAKRTAEVWMPAGPAPRGFGAALSLSIDVGPAERSVKVRAGPLQQQAKQSHQC
jgi:hypothetical protein